MRSFFEQGRGGGGATVAAGRGRRVLWRLLGCVAALSIAPQALAAPFMCDATFHQIRRVGGNTTHVSVVDRTTAPYTLVTRYTLAPALNGLGYNPSDNYLYAVGSSNRGLYRLGDGAAELSNVPITGIIPSGTGQPTLDAGTFDSAGNFFVAYNTGVIQRIDGITGASPSPTALTVPRQQDPSPPAGWTGTSNGHLLVGDWAYNPTESTSSSAVIYGTRSAEGGTVYLYRTRIENPGGASPAAYVSRRTIPGMTIANAVGTIFMDSNGMLFTYDNGATASNGFTRIDPVAGTVTAVSGAQPANQSDGANCPLATALVEPVIVLFKVTVGGAGGPFGFTLTNTGQATGSVSTATEGTPVQVDGDAADGVQPFTVSAFDTEVTITESSLPAGWSLADAVCTVEGGGTVGAFDAENARYTIPASEVASGAEFTCTFTNERLEADLAIVKTPDVTSVEAGGEIEYTLEVANHGPDTVIGAVVTDAPGSGLTCPAGNAVACSSTASPSACPAGPLTMQHLLDGVALGTLPADAGGNTVTFQYACTAD